MLAEWLLRNHRRRRRGAQGGERLAMLSSCVSSRWLGAMAAAEGVHWEETLTGFKWLGNVALRLEAEG
jgi:phosphoglucomutase